MHVIIRFIKNWTLPIAIFLGIVGYPIFTKVAFLTPYLIFTMLFLTYTKVSLKDLKLKWWHLWLLLVQIVGSVVVYFLCLPLDKMVAQSVLICFICPTATAAAVITGKLGGNIASITTYQLLCNMVVAILIPLTFPLIGANDGHDMSFFTTFSHLMNSFFPLLILPFICAELIRYTMPKVLNFLQKYHGTSFYLWGVGLTIVMAQTVESFVNSEGAANLITYMAIGSMLVCAVQFYLGKLIGRRYDDTISGGQSIGQKNTLLAIWLTHTYFNPLSSIGPGAYVLWQNLFNSYQIWAKRKKDSKVVPLSKEEALRA